MVIVLNSSCQSSPQVAAELCLDCGLCCNGVIFGDVKLQPGDDSRRLQALAREHPRGAGEEARRLNPSRRLRFLQPCQFFDGCRCRIYAERPCYCHEFECALFKEVKSGRLASASALRIIRQARKRVAGIQKLLRALGDTDEQASLRQRFRRTSRRLEQAGLDAKMAETYGRLTLAVHDLNRLLSERFYPGP